MKTVKMWIEKFGREVLIDDEHPLAVAQRARNAAAPADTQLGSLPAAQDAPANPPALRQPSHRKGRR